ncbi:MAG: 4-(cytidine 5'-diphospho)-2-C-methyl-D-erythritol kinase [Albidovulum sp.]|nr:4-(cytidine 5'-diphospho)-2-C-methyl-D-erythritol kinase [Albidovulum sp.]MDE0307220.1 4-(cytidine 5'-diphospho)-2-C-methyl-D-erythritol kinase [Albidovulum sp.]MDE0531948.1 4-(cytidine 5'-diphospho)-2-C-methyl-D-erythritol kinase [Albidovulum sp.]
MPGAVHATAHAKINLALHVLGRRRDGYHELDSIVAFAEFGDTVSAEACGNLSVEIRGPAADGVPGGEENIAYKAAKLLDPRLGAKIKIEKRIPAASGLGGGSQDAATVLRLLSELWGLPIGSIAKYTRLGADIPVCLAGGPARMRGVGEKVELLEAGWPELPLVLASPGERVSTASVFGGARNFGGDLVGEVPAGCSITELSEWLALQRNDLESSALSIFPSVGNVLSALSACRGCLLTRMSGSGGACFAIFESFRAAKEAAAKIRREHRSWWCVDTVSSPKFGRGATAQ